LAVFVLLTAAAVARLPGMRLSVAVVVERAEQLEREILSLQALLALAAVGMVARRRSMPLVLVVLLTSVVEQYNRHQHWGLSLMATMQAIMVPVAPVPVRPTSVAMVLAATALLASSSSLSMHDRTII
jgi:hypothetical protein